MKKDFFLVILLFSMLCCSGQQPDTVDLTLPIGLTKPVNFHRCPPNNSIYLEIAGHMMVASLNYERILFHSRDFYLSARIGAGYIPPTINTISLIGLVNGLYQVSDVLFLELGFGVTGNYVFWNGYYTSTGSASDTLYHKSGSFIDPILTGFAGIRVQKKKGFLFRFGFTPLLELTNIVEHTTIYMQLDIKNSFVPFVGMSFGYSF